MITRYEDPHVSAIWSRQHQIDLWREVELAWLREISPEGYRYAARVGAPTANFVADREKQVHHEFVAFLDCWAGEFPHWDAERHQDAEGQREAMRWVHYGLTSSDVIDAAMAMQLVASNLLLLEALSGLKAALAMVTVDLPLGIEQVGRTHGQWAQPRGIETPLLVLHSTVDRQRIRLQTCDSDLSMADLSGPTGGRALDGRAVERTLHSLNLTRVPASTQVVPRDSLVHWAHVIANTTTTCEAIADHYWFLAQSDVGEVRPRTAVAGSSSMPHKRNPALAENVRGLARLARGLASTLDESIVQRGDRDLAHSSVERVAVPDLLHLACTAIRRTVQVIHTYRYDLPHIAENLGYAEDFDVRSAEEVNERIRQGMSRADAMNKENPHD